MKPEMPPAAQIGISSDQANPFGDIPTKIKGTMSGWGQPVNLSTIYTDVTKLQSAIRASERGDSYQLTTLYRDMVLGDSHIQAEFSKRKMIVTANAWSIKPAPPLTGNQEKASPEDQAACDAVKAMIDYCDNWDVAMEHLLDATLWPMACGEKIYERTKPGSPLWGMGIRWRLKEISPVNPALFCYKLPYIAQGGFAFPGIPGLIAQNGIPMAVQRNSDHLGDTIYDPDSWEPTVRFYRTFPNGMIDFSWANIYAPDPVRHVIHRGNTLGGIWDNYGGPMRCLIFLRFFRYQGMDWWARSMERYGAPFVVILANAQQSDTMKAIEASLGLAGKLNGLALNLGSKVELKETNTSGMAEGFHKFLEFANEEISKVILGQTASSSQKGGGGLGQGSAQLHSEVRDDIALFDKKMLNGTLKRQVFEPFLKINGFQGRAPNMFFGGMDQGEIMVKAEGLQMLYNAGLRVAASGLDTLSEEVGLPMEYAPEGGMPNGTQNRKAAAG